MFSQPQVPSVSVDTLPADAFLLDVREDHEFAAGHAPGAYHLPMMQIPQRMAEVPADRDVVVVCRVGGRSAQVVGYLLGNGFDRVHNLDGGMIDWAAAGLPIVDDDGKGPRVA